jgi:hypothetical protein
MKKYKVLQTGRNNWSAKFVEPKCPECSAAGNKPSAVIPIVAAMPVRYETTRIMKRKYRISTLKCLCGCIFEHRVRIK